MKIIYSLLITVAFSLAGFAQTSLQGKVTDVETGEPILFGTVVVYQDGQLITGAETDFDGNYQINSIDAGVYDIEIRYTGYFKIRVLDIIILEGKSNKYNMSIQEGAIDNTRHNRTCCVPLIPKNNNMITAEQIKNLPTKSLNDIAHLRENDIYYLDSEQSRELSKKQIRKQKRAAKRAARKQKEQY